MDFQYEHDKIIEASIKENKSKIAKGMTETEFYVIMSRAMTSIAKIVNEDGHDRVQQIIKETFHPH